MQEQKRKMSYIHVNKKSDSYSVRKRLWTRGTYILYINCLTDEAALYCELHNENWSIFTGNPQELIALNIPVVEIKEDILYDIRDFNNLFVLDTSNNYILTEISKD